MPAGAQYAVSCYSHVIEQLGSSVDNAWHEIFLYVVQATYEETLINTANQKSGLNEAILGNINAAANPEDNAARIATLLREGANLIRNEEAAEEKAAQFEGQTIDDILSSRTSKRNMATKAGSTFSVASFRAGSDDVDAGDGAGNTNPGDDAAFWQDLLPEAVKAHQAAEASKFLVAGPRRRRKVNYRDPGHVRSTHDCLRNFAVSIAGRAEAVSVLPRIGHASLLYQLLHAAAAPAHHACPAPALCLTSSQSPSTSLDEFAGLGARQRRRCERRCRACRRAHPRARARRALC